jgi:cephalosporin-C deacetylase-like acetyl esterase
MRLRIFALSITCLAAGLPQAQVTSAPSFDYPSGQPVDIRPLSSRDRDGVTVQDITYAKSGDGRNAATLVLPRQGTTGPHAAILFVHWYEPPNPSSNRTEFVDDAVELANAGAISLLIDTPWSDPKWFESRDGDKDYEMSVAQVRELRRALDVLVGQPDVDRARVAYVGHDFGAMYGAVAVAVDVRPTHFVFMAGTRSFSDWFLFTPKREGAARDRFVAELAPLDPIAFLPKIAPRPVLLQFATHDKFVSKEAAAALAQAAGSASTVRYYEAEHALNAEATRDRQAWLKRELRLRP